MKTAERKAEKFIKMDSKGRICLGRTAPGVIGFQVIQRSGGRIVLQAMTAVPSEEAWLYQNKKSLARVRRGMQQSKAGKVRSLGSFAKYAGDDGGA